MRLTINLFGAKVRLQTIQASRKAEPAPIAINAKKFEPLASSSALDQITEYQKDMQAFQLGDSRTRSLPNMPVGRLHSALTDAQENCKSV